jgi:hypothetical protein
MLRRHIKMRPINTIVVAMALLLISAVAAIDDVPGQEESYMQNFYYANGAEVRFLQLEKNLERNILQGELVIDEILEKDPAADVTELERILEALRVLNQEIVSVDYSQDASLLAQEFILIKAQAKDLTELFRETARQSLGVAEGDMVKQQVQSQFQERFRQLDEQISQARNKYNGERVEDVLSQAGIEDDSLASQVKEGTLSMVQIRTRLMEKINGLEDHIKEQVKQRLSEQSMRQQVFGEAAMQMAGDLIRQNYQQKVMAQNQETVQNKDGSDDAGDGTQEGTGSQGENSNSGEDTGSQTDGPGSDSSGQDDSGNDNDSTGTNSANSGGDSGSDGSGDSSGSDTGSGSTGSSGSDGSGTDSGSSGGDNGSGTGGSGSGGNGGGSR